MKKTWKVVSAFLNRYINGTKGAISLMLAILMTPILSLSLLLVESYRYQSIVQLAEEISDLCAFSTLGEYDPFVEDRFGFLSVEQKNTISEVFKQNLEANKGMLGSAAIMHDSTDATGVYALSDDEILLQQILEQSEISVLSKTYVEALDIGDLLKQISEVASLKKLENLMAQGELLLETGKLAETVTDLIKGLKEVIDAHKAVDTAYTEYKRAYSKVNDKNETVGFAPDMLALAEALASAKASLAEDAAPNDIYKDSGVKDAIDALEQSQSTYKSKAEAVKNSLNTLSDKTSGLYGSVKKLGEQLSGFSEKRAEAGGVENFEPSTTDVIIATLTYVYGLLEGSITDHTVDSINTQVGDFEKQINKLRMLHSNGYKSVASSWTLDDIKREYGPLDIAANGFINDIQSALGRLEADFKTDDSLLKKLIELLDKITNIQAFYDVSLDSVVSTSSLYETSNPDLEDKLLIASIQTFCAALKTLEEAFEDDGFTALGKVLKALATAAVALGEFLVSVIGWAIDLVTNITALVAQSVGSVLHGGSVMEELDTRLLLPGYCAYNMPNRTNCTTGKALCGYDYRKVFLSHGGSMDKYGSTFGGSFATSLSNSGGTDTGFKGATMEYIMVGSTSEYENQMVVFVRLFLFRFVLNIIAVITSLDWGVSPIWIKLGVALCESFLDTVFLVSGESEYVYKGDLYISADGLDDLIKKLSKIVLGDNLTSVLKPGSGDGKGKGDDDPQMMSAFKCTYGDYLYLMTVISYKKEKIVDRVQNVIQMDANKFYQDSVGYSFDLDKTYTHIHSTVDYQLNPIFNIDALIGNGAFDVSISRYTGY